MNKLLWLPLAAAALTAGSASAQRSLVPGEITRGTLSNADPALDNGGYYDEYYFDARRGETVVLLMDSNAFDAYLRLGVERRAGGFRELAYDDDGGDGRNSRLQFVIPESGTYVVRASSLSGRSTGPYTITLAGGRVGGGYDRYDEPIEPVRPRPRRRDDRDDLVRAGERIGGYLSRTDPRLDGGEPFHLYRYNGRRGERISVTLRSSDFDAYLVLGTPGGRHGVGNALTRDDDGGGGRDSRIEYTLPEDRLYVIRVNPLGAGEGEYVLDVESNLQGGYAGRPGRRDDEPLPPVEDVDDGYSDVDNRLIGRWGLVGGRVTVDPRSWTSVAANAGYGYLEVSADGSYVWERNGRTRRGELEMYVPRRNHAPGTPYYRLTDGREEFYVFFSEYRGQPFMQVNSATSDQLVARGYLDPRSR
jgi:hypothetical protein